MDVAASLAAHAAPLEDPPPPEGFRFPSRRSSTATPSGWKARAWPSSLSSLSRVDDGRGSQPRCARSPLEDTPPNGAALPSRRSSTATPSGWKARAWPSSLSSLSRVDLRGQGDTGRSTFHGQRQASRAYPAPRHYPADKIPPFISRVGFALRSSPRWTLPRLVPLGTANPTWLSLPRIFSGKQARTAISSDSWLAKYLQPREPPFARHGSIHFPRTAARFPAHILRPGIILPTRSLPPSVAWASRSDPSQDGHRRGSYLSVQPIQHGYPCLTYPRASKSRQRYPRIPGSLNIFSRENRP